MTNINTHFKPHYIERWTKNVDGVDHGGEMTFDENDLAIVTNGFIMVILDSAGWTYVGREYYND